MKKNYITNEIVKLQTNRALIAFEDKLSAAETSRYAGIHADGEVGADGRKRYSRIGIQMQDYSAGTGDKNVITTFNVTPEYVHYLYGQVQAGVQEYEYRQSKIFGEPDADGLCTAQTISITRHAVAHDGTPAKCPWRIQITNGRGVKAKSRMGGAYMQAGSFQREKETVINITDMDMYSLLSRVDSYINLWEQSVAPRLIAAGRQLFEQFRNSSFGKGAATQQKAAPAYAGSQYDAAAV